MITIAVYNIKGGVGKTATAVNLAYLAACEGNSTLLCDLDPQGSASYYFRIRPIKKFHNRKVFKNPRIMNRLIRATDYEGLDLLPSSFSHRKLDLILDRIKNSRQQLQAALKPFRKEYQFLFLDCPPNITLLSENIFYAADYLLIPTIPTTLSIRTWKQLKDFFKSKDLPLKKLLPFFSMVETRKKLHRETMAKMVKKEKQWLSESIPYLADIEKMGNYRAPVTALYPRSRAAQSYQRLWQECESIITR
ncbi:MAG: AAA family ATPase [Xanthomonadaceae bacterium]|nr:AAA family ATPase [Xanthomonadaceae bacterium]